MDNNLKSKIFTTIYAIMLVVAFIGAVQLLYNATEMMTYSPFGEYGYGKFQMPIAIITFVAALVAFAAVAAGVISVCLNGKTVQKACRICMIAAVVILVILIIVSSIVWLNYVKPDTYPIYIGADSKFALYSAVMGMLVSQFAYCIVLAAFHVWDFVKSLLESKKKQKEVSAEALDEKSEQQNA